MRPPLWHPPIELSAKEQKVVKRIKKAKLFVFLREVRRELFDDEFQIQLSTLFKDRPENLTIVCKAWSVRNGKLFSKSAFTLDWEQGILHCPNQVAVPFQVGKVVHFPANICASCPLRARCTTSQTGRSISVHPDEKLLQELRERQLSAAGRATLRPRVAVEHTLAHIGQWQGNHARYQGLRKNLFDLRRIAVVHNLHVIARMPQPTQEEGP